MSKKSAECKSGASTHKVCVFCQQGKVKGDAYGKLLSKSGLYAHYFCMLFSSGLCQNGKTDKQGILGFLPQDILKEAKRGVRLKCSYCKGNGATIGCVVKNCSKNFHLGCGKENNSLHQFYDTFRSYCQVHRPMQNETFKCAKNGTCSICMTKIVAMPSMDTLQAPCCRKYWYHRDCIQSYATSAGLYFFKCPLCNNKADFQNEMLKYGIYIPDQDASWEVEPHAFQELLERYSNCDAAVCKCVEGRKFDKENSKWEIILCDFCGSAGSHVACNHLIKLGRRSACPDCHDVDKKSKAEQKAKCKVVASVSPSSTKSRSPYPGPSRTLEKKKSPFHLPDTSDKPASKSLRMSMKGKESKSTGKQLKRLASPDFGSPPKLKIQKKNNISPLTSSSASSSTSSCTSDSDDELLRSWKSLDTKVGKTNSKKSKSSKEMPSLKKIGSSGEKLSLKKVKLTDSSNTAGTSHEKHSSNKHKLKLSLAGLSSTANKKAKKHKAVDKSQPALTKWFSHVDEKKPSTYIHYNDNQAIHGASSRSSTSESMPNRSTSKKKRPVVIEWRGKQLLIHSPRVVLKKYQQRGDRASAQLKPRNLEIDMTDQKGHHSWNMELDMLSSIDTGSRVTRNMVDMEDDSIASHDTNSPINSKSLRSVSSTSSFETAKSTCSFKAAKSTCSFETAKSNCSFETAKSTSSFKTAKSTSSFETAKSTCSFETAKSTSSFKTAKSTCSFKTAKSAHSKSCQAVDSNSNNNYTASMCEMSLENQHTPTEQGSFKFFSSNELNNNNKTVSHSPNSAKRTNRSNCREHHALPVKNKRNGSTTTIDSPAKNLRRKYDCESPAKNLRIQTSYSNGSPARMPQIKSDPDSPAKNLRIQTSYSNGSPARMPQIKSDPDSPAKNLRPKTGNYTDSPARRVSFRSNAASPAEKLKMRTDTTRDSPAKNLRVRKEKHEEPACNVPFFPMLTSRSVTSRQSVSGRHRHERAQSLTPTKHANQPVEPRASMSASKDYSANRPDQQRNVRVMWYAEGTRQLDAQILCKTRSPRQATQPTQTVTEGCENTCPNSQSDTNLRTGMDSSDRELMKESDKAAAIRIDGFIGDRGLHTSLSHHNIGATDNNDKFAFSNVMSVPALKGSNYNAIGSATVQECDTVEQLSVLSDIREKYLNSLSQDEEMIEENGRSLRSSSHASDRYMMADYYNGILD